MMHYDLAVSEASTLRLLLSFIAKDLGIDDRAMDKNKIEITREIRGAIAKLKGETDEKD